LYWGDWAFYGFACIGFRYVLIMNLGTSQRAPVEAALIGYEIAGFEGALAALMHVTVDELCSRDKRMSGLIKRVRSV
jgi:hypothetical protein